MQPFLVDWWDQRLALEREARALAHQQRLLSPELLGMYNRIHTYRWVLDESGSNPFRRASARKEGAGNTQHGAPRAGDR